LGSRNVRVSEAVVSRPPIWARFLRDRRGVVAIAVAVLLPVLIGFAGIGIEVGLWFAVQRQNQSATDAAAISAALEYAAQIESGVPTNPTVAATTTANYNLFSTNPPNTLTLYPCYGYSVGGSCNTSSSDGPPNAVQVVLTQPLNTTFANIVTAIWGPSVNTVNVTTTAIAAFPQTSSACILALDPTAASAVLVDNNGTLANPNCWVASNSSSASALNCNSCTITGPTTAVGGDAVSNGGQLNGSSNRTYASAIADPYAGTLTHTFLTAGMPTAACSPPTVTGPPGAQTYSYPVTGNCIISSPYNSIPSGSIVALSAGTQIAGGLSFTGSGTINLSAGTYWITDGNLSLTGNITLECPSCSPGGPGVTIIFTQGTGGAIGTLAEIGNVTTIINAPSSGINVGLLLVQDAVAGANYIPPGAGTIGNAGSLDGLIYFPNTNLSLAGNIQTPSNCLVAIASQFYLTGNIGLNDLGCTTAGLATVPAIFSVFLAL
jgi:Flp pilus assembly protein TadG